MVNTILLLLIGGSIGILLHYIYLSFTCKIVGALNIDTSDETKDVYSFEIDGPLENLNKYKMVRVRIVDKTASDMKG